LRKRFSHLVSGQPPNRGQETRVKIDTITKPGKNTSLKNVGFVFFIRTEASELATRERRHPQWMAKISRDSIHPPYGLSSNKFKGILGLCKDLIEVIIYIKKGFKSSNI